MSRFIFVHGKNPELSLAEIVCFLKARTEQFRIEDYSEGCTVIETNALPPNTMETLGGTIKIGEVIFSSDKKNMEELSGEMEQQLDFDGLFKKLPNKVIFGVSSYRSRAEHEFFSDFFKDKMKAHGIRPGYIHAPEDRHSLTHVEVIKKHLADESIEFLVCGARRFYLGRTLFVHNPYEFQKRDVERPAQRSIFSIPPRLSRIMINLSGAKGGKLLDPFCGIGSILQEAALMGFDIWGVDKSRKCVEGCHDNLRWLEREYSIRLGNPRERVREGDARNLERFFQRNSVDAIVTEPYLGPPLQEKPDRNRAMRILAGIEGLYEEALKSMLAVLKPGGKIVIVAPGFRTGNGFALLGMKRLVESLGASLIDPLAGYKIPHSFPFLDYEERHRTIREINVIKKPA